MPYQQDFNIMGGDFNFTEHKIDRHYQHSKVWQEIKEELLLTDIRQDQNKTDPIYTYNFKTGKSRLDRFYVPTNKLHLTENNKVIPTHYSDHDANAFELNVNREITKPKLLSLLDNPQTLSQIQDHWRMWQGKKDDFENPLQWWDDGKDYIKRKIIHISSQNKKE